MKLVHGLLISLATMAVALFVYDQLRGEASRPSQERVSRPRVTDTADLERRLQALEAERRLSLQAVETDSAIFERLDALEAAARRNPETGGLPAMEPTPAETKKGAPAAALPSPDEPSAAEVRRWRQLREAARREDSVKRNRARVDRALNKLPVNLTKRQRERVHTAFAAFEPRVTQIWTEVKTQARETIAAGGDVDRVEIVAATTAQIQEEFAATLTGIVDHQGDAEAIAAALMPGRK